jgi:hypothetical protein
MINAYFQEIKRFKWSIISIIIVTLLSYSIYLFATDQFVINIGLEENLFEALTCLFFFLSSVFFFLSIKRSNFFMIALSIILFFGAGEEISWGQRIFNFKTLESIKKENIQGELNIHNLPIFNASNDREHHHKKGLQRLLEMNFMFRVFCVSFGFILPLLTFHVPFFSRFINKIKLPVPPITIGVFFFLTWLFYRIILNHLVPGKVEGYYATTSEIWEFLAAFIFLHISIYFYKTRNNKVLGKDFKQIQTTSKKTFQL